MWATERILIAFKADKIVGYFQILVFFVYLITHAMTKTSVIIPPHLYKSLHSDTKKTDITKDCLSRNIFPARGGMDSKSPT